MIVPHMREKEKERQKSEWRAHPGERGYLTKGRTRSTIPSFSNRDAEVMSCNIATNDRFLTFVTRPFVFKNSLSPPLSCYGNEEEIRPLDRSDFARSRDAAYADVTKVV